MRTQTAIPVVNIRFSEVILYYAFLACILFAVASCADDDDAKPNTAAQFIGTYDVADVSSYSSHTYQYHVTISDGEHGGLYFSNFADMFRAPVTATVNGNKITIKPQSFTNPSSKNTIQVSGSGTLSGNALNFTYTTTGYMDYTGTCKASKMQ